MNRKLSTKRSPAQVPAMHMRCHPVPERSRPGRIAGTILFLTVLDQFDLIAFRCVNEGDFTAVR